jgi:hypothetical protein
MKHVKNIVITVVIGLITVAVTSQLTSSKYPPCGLVAQGIGVSTYGCSNTAISTSPCGNEAVNSESMKSCIQANYYRSRTFPFGFTQHFGDSSNQIDSRPLLMNAVASFVTATTTFLAVIYLIELKKSSKKHQKSES